MSDICATHRLSSISKALRVQCTIAATSQNTARHARPSPLCDVSHMGEFVFSGPDALALVQKLITNDAAKLSENQALYSVMCDTDGIVIDDLVCFRVAADHFVWVVNVTKIDEDFQWVLRHSVGMNADGAQRLDRYRVARAAGPSHSREVLQRITKKDAFSLRYYWLAQTTIHTRHAEVPCMISRTGYSGERGYEIMVAGDLAAWVWDELLRVGQPLGIMPHGVAARESLRTEAGYLLNGNDMDTRTNPFEAGVGWVVKLTKDFIGKDALSRIKKNGVSRKMVGLEIEGNRPVRNGCGSMRPATRSGRSRAGRSQPA